MFDSKKPDPTAAAVDPTPPASTEEHHSMLDHLPGWMDYVVPGVGAARWLDHEGAFGHFFDESPATSAAPAVTPTAAPPPTPASPVAASPVAANASDAAKLINQQYMSPEDEMAKLGSIDAGKTMVGKLDTPEQRLAALNQLTQFQPGDPEKSESYCAPTSILAAAMYGQGGAGVTGLIDQIEKDSAKNKDFKFTQQQLEKIRKRAKDGTMTMADMQEMQTDLYKDLHDRMQKDPHVSAEDKKGDGISGSTVQSFIDSTGMKKMMSDNHMTISMIDNGGFGGNLGHFVLDINDPSRAAGPRDGGYNTVYDPAARNDGKQVITDPNQVDWYRTTKHGDTNG